MIKHPEFHNLDDQVDGLFRELAPGRKDAASSTSSALRAAPAKKPAPVSAMLR
jgi:hypothetical protein